MPWQSDDDMDETPLLLEIAPAAAQLGISTRYLRDLVTAGEVKLAGRTTRGCRLFERSELERYARLRAKIKARKHTVTA